MITLISHTKLPRNWFKTLVHPANRNTIYESHIDNQRIVQLAFQQAYGRLVATQPAWVSRGFDDRLLRPAMTTLLRHSSTGAVNLAPATGAQLALAWDRQFGSLYSTVQRIEQLAQLTPVANSFLVWLVTDLNRLRPKPE